jgi:rare lipoprotein A
MIRSSRSPIVRAFRALAQARRRFLKVAIPIGFALILTACGTQTASQPQPQPAPVAPAPPPLPAAPPPPPPAAPPPPAESQERQLGPSTTVKASYQGRSTAGHKTANGEHYNPNGLTAASRTLPIGSTVKVTNPDTGRSVKVRINDRGPFVHGRSLDLSKRAAEKIGITHKGAARVKVTRVVSHPTVDGDESSPTTDAAPSADVPQNLQAQ